MAVCQNCGQPRPARNRRYCSKCSTRASALWKARHRRLWAAAWRQSHQGIPPWLDGWPDLESRRAYFREYMRKWRRRKQALGDAVKSSTSDSPRNLIRRPAIATTSRAPDEATPITPTRGSSPCHSTNRNSGGN